MLKYGPHEIPRRDIRFSIAENAARDWFDGNPFLSAYCDGLSVFFPPGERFFIRSVAHYLPLLESSHPDLCADIRSFLVQEALHTREHEAYNAVLQSFNYPVALMEKRVVIELAMVKTPLRQLAFTAAIEHLTATLAHLVLCDERIFLRAPEAYRDLWTWHCLEEAEHKGVAFDVYRIVTAEMPAVKRYALRCTALIVATIDIHRVLFLNILDILNSKGKFSKIEFVWTFMKYVVFYPGYYRRSVFYFMRFFLPFFDPWKASSDDASVGPWRSYFHRHVKDKQNA